MLHGTGHRNPASLRDLAAENAQRRDVSDLYFGRRRLLTPIPLNDGVCRDAKFNSVKDFLFQSLTAEVTGNQGLTTIH